TGYFMPEWASFEIFRQHSQFGLGAALEAFRGEFLYGMPVGIAPAKERGLSRGARVAEIEALTGRPPGEPRAANAPAAIAERWQALRHAIGRRPERLEIWTNDPDKPAMFMPARFSDGATFALRDTALHRNPTN